MKTNNRGKTISVPQPHFVLHTFIYFKAVHVHSSLKASNLQRQSRTHVCKVYVGTPKQSNTLLARTLVNTVGFVFDEHTQSRKKIQWKSSGSSTCGVFFLLFSFFSFLVLFCFVNYCSHLFHVVCVIHTLYLYIFSHYQIIIV